VDVERVPHRPSAPSSQIVHVAATPATPEPAGTLAWQSLDDGDDLPSHRRSTAKASGGATAFVAAASAVLAVCFTLLIVWLCWPSTPPARPSKPEVAVVPPPAPTTGPSQPRAERETAKEKADAAERERKEKEREAEADAARKAVEDAKVAQRQKAIEDSKPRPSRANYNKIPQFCYLSDFEALLGPHTSEALDGDFFWATWVSKPADPLERPTIITARFRGGPVYWYYNGAKSITGP
jgi:hypothetical protein